MIQIDMEMPVSCDECPARDDEYKGMRIGAVTL